MASMAAAVVYVDLRRSRSWSVNDTGTDAGVLLLALRLAGLGKQGKQHCTDCSMLAYMCGCVCEGVWLYKGEIRLR